MLPYALWESLTTGSAVIEKQTGREVRITIINGGTCIEIYKPSNKIKEFLLGKTKVRKGLWPFVKDVQKGLYFLKEV